MRLNPRGLASTVHPSQAKLGYASHAVNVRTTKGIIEARPGIGEMWQRTAANNGDKCWGAGFGRYNGTEEFIFVIQHNGSATAQVYSIGIDSTTGEVTLLQTRTSAQWTRTASDWYFVQNGEYIYGVNATDGMFRKKIGDNTEVAWRQVQLQIVNSAETTFNAEINNPRPDYVVTDVWATGSGDFAGTYTVLDTCSFGGALTATVADNQILIENAGGRTGNESFDVWVVITLTGTYDFTQSRYWGIPIETRPYDDTDGDRTNEEPILDVARAFDVRITEDATAPAASISDLSDAKWKQVRCYARPTEISPDNDNFFVGVGLAVDFDHANFGATNNLDAVKKIAIKVPMRSGNDWALMIGSPYQGGTMMSKARYWHYMDGDQARTIDPVSHYGQQTFIDLEYAITQFDTGASLESTPSYETVNGIAALGLGKWNQSLPLGASVRVTYSAPSGIYERVRIYRRRHSDGRKWYLVYQSSDINGGTWVDSRVDAAGDCYDWSAESLAVAGSTIIRDADYDFGVSAALLGASAITSWRGHMVLGVGEEVYLSYQGQPHRYVAPYRSTVPGAVTTDDPTMGRTLYMSYTLSDKVLALHAPDELYGVGYEGVYAMVGESALSASNFRKLPGSYGALGARASAPYKDGILVAAREGLFFYQISRLGASIEETRTSIEELTAGVRGTYQFLIAKGAPNDVVVSVVGTEIYVARGRYVMKLNSEGEWEFHAYSSDALQSGATSPSTYGTVTAFPTIPDRGTAVTRHAAKNTYGPFDFTQPTSLAGSESPGWIWFFDDAQLGKFGVSRQGILMRLDSDWSGNEYKVDANYAIPWAYAYTDFNETSATLERLEAAIESQSTDAGVGVVRFLIEAYDARGGTKVFAVDRAANETRLSLPGANTQGGSGHLITVAGQSSAHRVIWIDAAFSKQKRDGT